MHHLTEILALVAVMGVAAQWLGWRLHIPTIVLLGLAGLVAGPITGLIRPSEALGETFRPLIQIGVAAILFEGGLSLRLHELRATLPVVRRLVTVAVPLSLGLGAASAHWIGGLSWPVAVVFGAIIVVTGPTVVLPLLRQARLRKRPASLLKWEGIVNDPTGALLAVVAFEYFTGPGAGNLGGSLGELTLGIVASAGLGGLAGWLTGRAFIAGQVPEYLKGPMALAGALGVFALSNLLLHEAGLVAATAFGLVLGNMGLPAIEELRRFKENVAVLLVSGIFLLLTADLDPLILGTLGWRDAALLCVLLVLVRPLAIALATAGTAITWQERVLVGWIGPRGVVAAAVAGVFGPALVAAGFADGERLLPLVFALIGVTVVLHGFSLPWLARRLDLSARSRNGLLISGAGAWSTGLAATLTRYEVPVLLADSSYHRLRRARHSGLPVYFGELLSEHAEAELELGDYGSLLAVSANDAYNALVCAQFAQVFGREHVFQFAPSPKASERRQPAKTARGRSLFDPETQYEDLEQRWYQGWTFQATSITEGFRIDALLAVLPDGAIPLMVIRDGPGVRLLPAGSQLKAVPGERVLWFGLKPD